MLISQQNQLLHTFPRTIFTVTNFTTGGYSCMPDKIPIDRRISYPLASNLYKASCSPCSTLLCPSCNSDHIWAASQGPTELSVHQTYNSVQMCISCDSGCRS